MEKDNNKIDELFRKGLDEAKFDFNEENWQIMQSRLENRTSKKKIKRVFLLAATSAAAIAALFFIWSKDLFTLDQMSNGTDSQVAINDSTVRQGEKITEESSSAGLLDQDKIEVPSNLGLVDPLLLTDDMNKWQPTAFLEVVDSKNRGIQYISSKAVFIPEIKQMKSSIQQFHLSNELLETMTIDPDISTSQIKYVNNIPKSISSVLSVVAGPDLSSVRGAGSSSISENVGLVYSYPVINRLSISVGATYAKKNYQSPYSFYSPANPPQLTQIPSQVSAECDVIDIPLSASYTLLQNKKVKFNVSAGLSSYFMLKEKYTFDYDGSVSSGNMQSAVYEITGENQHIFGVADISVSIEKKVNDKINVGIKPFIKMPLTGIGYGRVDLESKGITLMVGMSL